MPKVPLRAMYSRLSPTEGQILKTIALNPGISQRDLASALYEGREDGGPMWAQSVVGVTVKRLRAKIKPLGWTVIGRQRNGYWSTLLIVSLHFLSTMMGSGLKQIQPVQR